MFRDEEMMGRLLIASIAAMTSGMKMLQLIAVRPSIPLSPAPQAKAIVYRL